MQVNFGSGYAFGIRTDTPNLPVAFFGVLQEWSLDIDQKLVTLFGQNKDPVDVAPGERTITGKLKFARVQATTFGNLVLGVTPTANAGFDIVGPETHTSGTTTFTVTNGTALTEDYGLYYHNTGIALQPVTAAPSTGQYIPGAAGVGNYTIAAGDESVALDAFYQTSIATAYEIDLNTSLMGTGPTCEINCAVPYSVNGVAKKLNFQIYQVRFSKTSNSFKNTSYYIPELDFQASPAGKVLRWVTTE
jgi:hypothetical protein